MLKSISKQIWSSYSVLIDKYSSLHPWTNVYGFVRTSFAIGLLLSFIFNDMEVMFPIRNVDTILFSYKISFYNLLAEHLVVSKTLTIIILLWVISGYIPQLSSIFHWWICYSYFITTPLGEGGDQIMSLVTLVLIPLCITDNRINHWYKPKPNNNQKTKLFVWSTLFILSIQFSILYFNACISKLGVNEWLYGTAPYYWFTHDTHGVAPWLKEITYFLTSNNYVVVFLSWGTMIGEFFLGAWFFMKRSTWNWKVLFFLGVLFHLAIVLVFGLISFFFSMLAVLILYLFPIEQHLKFIKNEKNN